MDFIANLILGLGAFGTSLYCFVLSKRLRKLSDLDTGVGAAVVDLSREVAQMTQALDRAKTSAHSAEQSIHTKTERAEDVAQRLELLLASMHDLDMPTAPQQETRQ